MVGNSFASFIEFSPIDKRDRSKSVLQIRARDIGPLTSHVKRLTLVGNDGARGS
jgi:hypothetical protein